VKLVHLQCHVNPIDFENAEGNLGLANSMFEFISTNFHHVYKRFNNSTVTRNIGVPLHTLIAMKSLLKIEKLIVNRE
jgi:adenylosuccinate lyase